MRNRPPPPGAGRSAGRGGPVLMSSPMERTVANLSVALSTCDRPPRGRRLAETEGHVNGMPFDVTMTEAELHFTFADRNGPRFCVSLNQLAKQATIAIELLITGTRPML